MLDLESESDSDVSSLYRFICLGRRAVARLAESFTKFPGLCLMIRRGLLFTFNELELDRLEEELLLLPAFFGLISPLAVWVSFGFTSFVAAAGSSESKRILRLAELELLLASASAFVGRPLFLFLASILRFFAASFRASFCFVSLNLVVRLCVGTAGTGSTTLGGGLTRFLGLSPSVSVPSCDKLFWIILTVRFSPPPFHLLFLFLFFFVDSVSHSWMPPQVRRWAWKVVDRSG